MRSTFPTEQLEFNDWMIYIQKELIKMRLQKLNHYEQNLSSKTSVQDYQRRIGPSNDRGRNISSFNYSKAQNH